MPETAVGARVTLRSIARTYASSSGQVQALAPTDLNIEPGEFVAIIGPSGCGKSTLLRIIAGLDSASGGTLDSGGNDRIAFVFQDAQLLPWRTVAANVALPFELGHGGIESADARKKAVADALAAVELSDAAHRYPAELSGGMRMRASIARALVTRPRLLLMDEPFAALDELTRNRLDERLRELWARDRFTVVFVTHSIGEAAFLAERAVVMSKRPGRIVHDARIDLPEARTTLLRGEASFAAASAVLLRALTEGAA